MERRRIRVILEPLYLRGAVIILAVVIHINRDWGRRRRWRGW